MKETIEVLNKLRSIAVELKQCREDLREIGFSYNESWEIMLFYACGLENKEDL